MKDMEHPMHSLREIYHFSGDSRSQIGLAPNEFIDNPDQIGLFNSHNEPYEYLTVDYVDKFAQSPGIYGIEIVLENKVHEYERRPYTLMILLSELGGAYAIISALPPFLIASAVEKMFKNRIAELMPYKHEEGKFDQSK